MGKAYPCSTEPVFVEGEMICCLFCNLLRSRLSCIVPRSESPASVVVSIFPAVEVSTIDPVAWYF